VKSIRLSFRFVSGAQQRGVFWDASVTALQLITVG